MNYEKVEENNIEETIEKIESFNIEELKDLKESPKEVNFVGKDFSYNEYEFDSIMLNRASHEEEKKIKEVWENKNITYDQWVENGKLITAEGIPSLLSEKEYKLVRTKGFKEWFGDWKNNKDDISDIVLDNVSGEPKMWYRGDKSRYTSEGYITKPDDEREDPEKRNQGVFFTDKKEQAIEYMKDASKSLFGEVFANEKIDHPENYENIKNWIKSSAATDPRFWNKIHGDSFSEEQLKWKGDSLTRSGYTAEDAKSIIEEIQTGRRSISPSEIIDRLSDNNKAEELFKTFGQINYGSNSSIGKKGHELFTNLLDKYKNEPVVLGKTFIRAKKGIEMEVDKDLHGEIKKAREDGYDVVLNKKVYNLGGEDEMIVFNADNILVEKIPMNNL